MAEQYDREKYAYLDQLSTERLEEFIRADIELPGNSNYEVIFHILEVIKNREKKHQTGSLPDVDEAWTEFQQYYNISEGERLSLYPVEAEDNNSDTELLPIVRGKSAHRYLKLASVVAITIICALGLVIGAQAAGIDIFGAIGRWTDETFHFLTSPANSVQDDVSGAGTPLNPRHSEYHSALQNAFDKSGITEKLAPTWFPEEFEMSEPKVLDTDLYSSISCNFIGPEGKFFRVQALRYYLGTELDSHAFEKDDSNVTMHHTKERTFYIISNLNTTTATWSDDNLLVLSIAGNLSENDMKVMIDSIGG